MRARETRQDQRARRGAGRLTTNADSKVRVKSGSAEGTVDIKINSTNEKPTAVISIQPRDQAPAAHR